MFADPDHRLDRPVMRSRSAIVQEKLRFNVRAAKVEYASLFLLAAGEKMMGARRDRDGANDVIMREGVKHGAVDSIPDLTISYHEFQIKSYFNRLNTHAVKSALPDAARDSSMLSFVLQTAPL